MKNWKQLVLVTLSQSAKAVVWCGVFASGSCWWGFGIFVSEGRPAFYKRDVLPLRL